MTTPPIRVLLVDDHAVFRQPLAFMLNREPDLAVVAQAGSLAEARAIMAEEPPPIDVAIVDLRLPDGLGIDLIKELKTSNAEAHSMLLTADQDKLLHAQALEAGASGVIGKTAQLSDIVDGIRRIHAGGSIQTVQELMELLRLAGQERERDEAKQMTLARLTPRERQVLGTLRDGLDNRAIGDRLFISPETARTHVVKLLSKLNVESRLQAAIFAIENGVESTEWSRNGTTNSFHGER